MSNFTPPSDEAPGVGAFLLTLESIERVQAEKQSVIRSRVKPDHLFKPGHEPWNARRGDD